MLELPDKLACEPAIITKNGKLMIITLSFEQLESLVKKMEILSKREFMIQLQEGIQQADTGETISLEELKAI
ncbi:hypothetical protein [Coleofasciculus sp. FACHB-T130]|uniref:hypothetical protein n=1 Tax=Cyanophyceae TaxID=3028117 RepID=UPI0018F00FF1|nr:hypothetical protein [Coleofasciculus sp. FACHB-T130]